MYIKSFSRISKIISVILILTCFVFFNKVASAQVVDHSGSPTGSSSSDSNNSDNKTVNIFLVAAGIALLIGAAVVIITKLSENKKDNESEKNKNNADSTSVNKSDSTIIKKKDKLDNIDEDILMNYR